MLSDNIKQLVLTAQQNEMNEQFIYKKLATVTKNPKNREILEHIGEDEERHQEIWKAISGVEVKPQGWVIAKYYWLARIFGLTFGLKLMEQGEQNAQEMYEQIYSEVEEARAVQLDEQRHEKELIDLLHEEKLHYMGSIVLGLNDALVELTGALAGLTFALQNGELIALTGVITGIAASFSMGASEYLSTKAEKGTKRSPMKSAFFTFIAYLFTVAVLVAPYILIANVFYALAVMLVNAVIIVALFNYYISITEEESFKHRFFEMAGISLGVAALSFGVGYLVRQFFDIEI